MSAARKKMLKRLIETARDSGWRVEKRKCNHWGFFPANGNYSPIFTGGTPTDYRSVANLKAQLRRAGLKC